MPLKIPTPQERELTAGMGKTWMIMETLRKSVIILDETNFNIHDLMGATVTGMI